jgi:hypothetical protein
MDDNDVIVWPLCEPYTKMLSEGWKLKRGHTGSQFQHQPKFLFAGSKFNNPDG